MDKEHWPKSSCRCQSDTLTSQGCNHDISCTWSSPLHTEHCQINLFTVFKTKLWGDLPDQSITSSVQQFLKWWTLSSYAQFDRPTQIEAIALKQQLGQKRTRRIYFSIYVYMCLYSTGFIFSPMQLLDKMVTFFGRNQDKTPY